MKRLLLLFFLLSASGAFAASTEIITAHITITNAPLGNTNTITYNATTRSWTNSVSSSPSTLIQQTNSIPYSVTNLWLQLGTYPVSVIHRFTNTATAVSVVGGIGQAMTVSVTPGWATVAYQTNTVGLPNYVVRVPFNLEGLQDQTNIASGVLAIMDRTTNAFGTNWLSMSNFVTLSTAQAVGNKIITNSLLHLSGLTAATNISGEVTWFTNGQWTNGTLYAATARGLSVPGTGAQTIDIGSTFSGGATNDLANAIGWNSLAGGYGSIAFGHGAKVLTERGIAIGIAAKINLAANEGNYGMALGGLTDVEADYGIALGYDANVSEYHTNSMAIGAQVTTTKTNQIQLGLSTHTTSIRGIAEVSRITAAHFNGAWTNQAKMSEPAFSFTTLGNGNNIAISFGSNAFVRLDGSITIDSSICGIVGGYDGVRYLVENNTGFGVTFAQNTVDPTPANRIVNYTGTDYALVDGGFLELIYDAAESRWNTIPLYPITASATNSVYILQTNAVDFGSGNNRLNFTGHGVSINATNATGTNQIGIQAHAGWLLTNAVVVGQSSNLNLIAGSGVTILATHISGTNAFEISASGGSGWTWAETNVTTYASNTTDTPHIVQPFIGSTNFAWLVGQTNGSRSLSSTQGFGINSNVTQLLAPGGATGSPSYSFANDPDVGLANFSANAWGLQAGGSYHIWTYASAGYPTVLNSVGFSASQIAGASALITMDSANVLNQRNGTTPQTNRVSLSYSDASNNSGLEEGYDVTKGAYFLRSWANGTHTNAPIMITARTSSETNALFHTNGSSYFFGPVAVMPKTPLAGDSFRVDGTNGTATLQTFAVNENSMLTAQTNFTATVSTADATVTTIYTFTPEAGYAYLITFRVIGQNEADTSTCAFNASATYSEHGGSVTQIGVDTAVGAPMQSASLATTAVTTDTSGGAIRIRVTGVALTDIDWRIRGEIIRVNGES